ncbi:hypothetical protein [Polyangium aurulentum]|uniref:hypothetical protein n=1 Tax=Polyangium aurulentum TaxID=2567896 RepID=UPI0010AE06AC|nr:hypothetical protein [Polyangium aurulentum]UQA60051.1 hypothetical protein E8A73_006070 [Polyangium aurulentum]
MRYDRTVIAYHGCDARVAEQLLAGTPFKPSQNDFDWLGTGVYFWEFGFDRALRFARFQKSLGKVKEPAVVGALLQLGNCFDLTDTRFTSQLQTAYAQCVELYEATGKSLPVNVGATPDKKLRRLDCTVLNLYLAYLDDHELERFQTVRAAFEEGPAAFPGSMIRQETHVQIAVRDPRCIIGVFRPMMPS